jgi:hypothetical protein
MALKRRSFVNSLLIAPAIPAALDAQNPSAAKEQPTPQPNTPAVQNSRQPQAIAPLKLTNVDLTAETRPTFFTDEQLATLAALGRIMMPPLKNNPGAIDAKAPEFLDFLIRVSPEDRQALYRDGLDALNRQSRQRFSKGFMDLNATDAGALLRPLLVVRPWPEDFPEDPLQRFVAQVHNDLRNATMNSREWAEAAARSGHRFSRNRRGSGLYWAPIDPVV